MGWLDLYAFVRELLVLTLLFPLAGARPFNRPAVDAKNPGSYEPQVIYLPIIHKHIPPLPGAFNKIRPPYGAGQQPTSLGLDWGDSDGASSYFYCYDTTNDNACSSWISSGTISQATIAGLSYNTTYYWQVKASNSRGDTYAGASGSAYWSFSTLSAGEILAGEFQMGCDQAHIGFYTCALDELPLHSVYLDAYLIDRYEVTNAQYAQCVAAGVCDAPALDSSYTRPSYYGNPAYADYPVIYVSWHDAERYCAWAGKRLPSEAEWEKAARGASDTRPYPWGDQEPVCNDNKANFGGLRDCGVGDTDQVGGYPQGASPDGVMDMIGNVWEWVNDWYQSNYYSSSPASNPPGPADGTYKVMRGGSWTTYSVYLGLYHRLGVDPSNRYHDIGFRCAVSLGP